MGVQGRYNKEANKGKDLPRMMSSEIGSHALNNFLNGPSLRSFAASVKARNLLKPVVAAPLPRAAARVSTSSLEVMAPDDAVALVMAGAIEVFGADEGTIMVG